MSDADVQRLLHAAAKAPTQQEAERLVGEAETLRSGLVAQAAAAREVDLANAVVQDHLTPTRVHERHTAATDWIAGLDTSGGANVDQEMTAQASLWYSKAAGIRPWPEEFQEQAKGQARKLAGAFGEQAAAAQEAFLSHTAALYERELRAGLFTQAESGLPQVGEPGNPVSGGTVGPPGASGLPGEATSSERAPIMQAMENNTSSGIHDALMPDNNAEAHNGGQRAASLHRVANDDAEFMDGMSRDELRRSLARIERDHGEDHPLAQSIRDHLTVRDLLGTPQRPFVGSKERNPSMQTAPCPSCGGHGRVAVRTQAASGLDQVQQIVDPHDAPSTTPLNPDVAFPWEMAPDSSATIQEAEKQVGEREQLKGASLETKAQRAARTAYMQVMAGQDDSGWLGDMGAGGVGPGEQDGGNPGPGSNLGQPDRVYGFGGDQGDRAIKPYGADEANDVTNNPGMGYQPGQPTQYDQGGRGMTTGASRIDDDPQLQQALAYARQRRAFLENQARG